MLEIPEKRLCTDCGETKFINEFSPNGIYFHSRCKPCNARYMKNWRDNNLERANATAKKSRDKRMPDVRAKNKEYVIRSKNKPCMDCGIQYPPYIMDFDHRDPKTKKFNISGNMGKSFKAISNEIAKCDVVCANCHRERTFTQRKIEGDYDD